MPLAHTDSFPSSVPVGIPFVYFSHLIAVATTVNNVLNRSGESGILVLFEILAGRLSAFHC